jgi:hypothetical protein
MRTGATENTPDNIMLGTGIIYLNFVDFNSLGTLVGATTGGVGYNLNRTVRDILADDLQGGTKGLVVPEEFRPEITVNLLEITETQLLALFKQDKTVFENSDYISNITYIGLYMNSKNGDTGKMIKIQIKNVIPTVENITSEDNGESTLQVSFRGTFDIANVEDKISEIKVLSFQQLTDTDDLDLQTTDDEDIFVEKHYL